MTESVLAHPEVACAETPPDCDVDLRIRRMEYRVKKRNAMQPEFLQAFSEVCESLRHFLRQNPQYISALEVIAEPERVVTFRVPWFDDKGSLRVNCGYRVQYSSAIGPCKGGLRFHPSVSLSVIKFLGFEQIFKNSLTGLPMGGGKGGSDFDPKGKSVNEIRRFCQSFMTELAKHIGPSRDVPAGDIGVGTREIGFLFGQYKRLSSNFEGALTGKDVGWGGSEIRPEATGYGCAYFAENVLTKLLNESLRGKSCTLSGCGNVAVYCAEKLLAMGAKVLTLSDSEGMIYCSQGFSKEDIQRIKEAKAADSCVRVRSFADGDSIVFQNSETPWAVAADLAFPCAKENEVDDIAAAKMCKNGCRVVVEGSNMPLTPKATETFTKNGVIVCPGKAANAGGVAVSGLEMSQNAMRLHWTREEVDTRLKQIMSDIFEKCTAAGKAYGRDERDLVAGANVDGFRKVADAIIAEGYL
ncbi:NADP-specific glutamate dehydrogenase, putative [Eimeria tenella]|uniref:Glutamate dehydrogenase n=1 Tax=Eimeria tenella TaxID=5802 RepID=U6L466_EIMTE|nr:NADP-specific glutamate dehydrogenase, putative [Eimeria tenella]CDJ42560.1 NADP-specific glutamate dehydrogenase, putative [Eimeria tenella]|eukprot:XP_013233310.1 NADP-specific glutamate dehydrogenase, putative [Eimeria tenella]